MTAVEENVRSLLRMFCEEVQKYLCHLFDVAEIWCNVRAALNVDKCFE
jgi:hypothetical protein